MGRFHPTLRVDMDLSNREIIQKLPRMDLSRSKSAGSEIAKQVEKHIVKPSNKSISHFDHLSILYATMLVLLGFVFPISEALRDEWMATHISGMFMTYLFLVSSAFIIYLQVYERILKTRHQKDQERQEKKLAETQFGAINHALDVLGGLPEPSPESTGSDNDSDVIVLPGITVNNTTREKMEDENSICSGEITSEIRPRNTLRPNNSSARSLGRCSVRSDTFMENYGKLRHRRTNIFSVVSLDSEAPDEIYDFITHHQGTATLASGDTNLFLKGGTLLFAVANLIYVALRIDAEHRTSACMGQMTVIYPHYFHLLFIVLQTFMLAKESKFALRRRKLIASFGLMHLAATNLCVWFRFLVFEVMEGLHHGLSHGVSIEHHGDDIHSVDTHHENEYDQHNGTIEHMVENTTKEIICGNLKSAMGVVEPFLFPFILEYSLTAMSTLIFLYGNINIRVSKELYSSISSAVQEKKELQKKHGTEKKSDFRQPVMEKSHTGLSLGVIIFAGVAVSMIMFFHWSSINEEFSAQMCFSIGRLVMLFLLTVCTAMGMYYLQPLSTNMDKSNTLDHMLLFLPYAFLMTLKLFTLMALALHVHEEDDHNVLVSIGLAVGLLSVVQSTSQVAFIVDGMQKVSKDKKQAEKKRGRGIVTLLILTNVAMWAFKSFQQKKADQSVEIHTYGQVAWTIISNVALPLELFFYFHSAICLAHMWTHCYDPEETEEKEEEVEKDDDRSFDEDRLKSEV